VSDGDVGINATKPHPARIYDYYLGGKSNFPADREVADQILALAPESRDNAQLNRSFLRRVVRFLAGEAGIRQFLDIGTGLPTQGNVHEVAQAVAPDARIVYVDYDPIVLSHGRALLAGEHVTIVQGDLRDPGGILGNPELREVLDFEQPIALLLVAILHFIHDRDDPAAILQRLREALPAGSYLAVSHATGDFDPARTLEALKIYKGMLALRSHAEIERFFEGFDLLDPGLVEVDRWRPDAETKASFGLPVPIYGGVGRLR